MTMEKYSDSAGYMMAILKCCSSSPDARGKGIGSMLATHAIKELGATKVDVNEQNQQALGFTNILVFQ